MIKWTRIIKAKVVKQDMLKKKAGIFMKTKGPKATEEEIQDALTNSTLSVELLEDNAISKDSPYYDEVLNKAMEDNANRLIVNNIVTKDSPYYEKTMLKAIEYPETAFFYLKDGKIKENDSFYEKAIESAISQGRFAWYAIEEGIVSKGSPYYEKAKAKADKWSAAVDKQVKNNKQVRFDPKV